MPSTLRIGEITTPSAIKKAKTIILKTVSFLFILLTPFRLACTQAVLGKIKKQPNRVVFTGTAYKTVETSSLLSPRNTGSLAKLQDTRSSPSIRPKPLGIGPLTSFLPEKIKNGNHPTWVTSAKRRSPSLRWHYPNQVTGRR